MSAAEELILERRDGLGLVTLNRPQALNTLSLSMYRRFAPALLRWGEDETVQAVVVRGAGGRAFCAGGDVVAIYDERKNAAGAGYTEDFFREEYTLIAGIHRFPKPYVALMDGVTMGGGAGVAVNGAFRVVTEQTLFAMPEVQIGLFPDVGASRFLNLCPGKIGLYLALTGKRLGPADAIYCGFGTHFVPRARLDAVVAALAELDWKAGGEMRQVEAVLAIHSDDPGPALLAVLYPDIDRCFAGDTVEEIATALAEEPGAWAQEAREAMARASPLSLKLAFHQLRRGVGMNVEAALSLEYRMTQHCMAGHDFFEGIRALLVDKDRKPRWQHESLQAVSDTEVARYFESLGERELSFG
jgi:enoyl-CoA hydratase